MSEHTDLEQRLADELGGRARDLEPPSVSAPGLVQAGRREQRRRAGLLAAGASALVAAAVVVAVAVVPGGGRSSSPAPVSGLTTPPTLGPTPATPLPALTAPTPAPATVSDLPLGPATDVPWWSDGLLHYGAGRTATIAHKPTLFFDAGTTLVLSGRAAQVASPGGSLVTLPYRGAQDGGSGPVLSADGRLVAWYGHRELVAYDVATHSVVGRLPFGSGRLSYLNLQVPQYSDSRRIDNITSDGRIVFVPPGPAHASSPVEVWTPGAPTATVLKVPGGEENDPWRWPGGMSWRAVAHGSAVATLATIGSDGRLTPVAVASFIGVWNPTGSTIAEDLQRIASPFRPGFGESAVPLPTDVTYWDVVGWEDDHDLVYAAQGERGRQHSLYPTGVLVRCRVPALTCQRIAGTPTAPVPGVAVADDEVP